MTTSVHSTIFLSLATTLLCLMGFKALDLKCSSLRIDWLELTLKDRVLKSFKLLVDSGYEES